MINRLESIVVVAWRKGFVAHVRFADPFDDADLSAATRYLMSRKIDRYLQSKGIFV